MKCLQSLVLGLYGTCKITPAPGPVFCDCLLTRAEKGSGQLLGAEGAMAPSACKIKVQTARDVLKDSADTKVATAFPHVQTQRLHALHTLRNETQR